MLIDSEEGTPPTVHQAFAAVMADVRAIEKSQRNQQQGFRFRGIDDVMQEVGPALRSHGVFIVPTAKDMTSETYQTKQGTTMRNVTVTMRFTVYGPAGDSFTGVSFGESADAGDKAVTKAQSVAYRTFLLQSLTVPTGDVDPDAHTHERAAADHSEDVARGDEARGELLAKTKPYGWTPDRLRNRFRTDYDRDLLRTHDVEMITSFADALVAEAEAELAEATKE